jgi:hypothetical protein
MIKFTFALALLVSNGIVADAFIPFLASNHIHQLHQQQEQQHFRARTTSSPSPRTLMVTSTSSEQFLDNFPPAPRVVKEVVIEQTQPKNNVLDFPFESSYQVLPRPCRAFLVLAVVLMAYVMSGMDWSTALSSGSAAMTDIYKLLAANTHFDQLPSITLPEFSNLHVPQGLEEAFLTSQASIQDTWNAQMQALQVNGVVGALPQLDVLGEQAMQSTSTLVADVQTALADKTQELSNAAFMAGDTLQETMGQKALEWQAFVQGGLHQVKSQVEAVQAQTKDQMLALKQQGGLIQATAMDKVRGTQNSFMAQATDMQSVVKEKGVSLASSVVVQFNQIKEFFISTATKLFGDASPFGKHAQESFAQRATELPGSVVDKTQSFKASLPQVSQVQEAVTSKAAELQDAVMSKATEVKETTTLLQSKVALPEIATSGTRIPETSSSSTVTVVAPQWKAIKKSNDMQYDALLNRLFNL